MKQYEIQTSSHPTVTLPLKSWRNKSMDVELYEPPLNFRIQKNPKTGKPEYFIHDYKIPEKEVSRFVNEKAGTVYIWACLEKWEEVKNQRRIDLILDVKNLYDQLCLPNCKPLNLESLSSQIILGRYLLNKRTQFSRYELLTIWQHEVLHCQMAKHYKGLYEH